MKKAFTLIELLVVVLIIGILAAIALPQYQKAVEKTKATEARVNLAALVTAEKAYKMANGSATSDLDELDIQLLGSYDSTTKKLTSDYFVYHTNTSSSGEGFEAVANRIDNGQDDLEYYIYFSSNGSYHCVAKNEKALWICETISGFKNTKPNDNGYYYHIIR